MSLIEKLIDGNMLSIPTLVFIHFFQREFFFWAQRTVASLLVGHRLRFLFCASLSCVALTPAPASAVGY
jgi:hypothetical protein